MADCETFDHVFDGQIVECVRDPGDPENLLLDTWNGHRSKTAPTFEHEGISFVAKSLAGELVRVEGFGSEHAQFKDPRIASEAELQQDRRVLVVKEK